MDWSRVLEASARHGLSGTLSRLLAVAEQVNGQIAIEPDVRRILVPSGEYSAVFEANHQDFGAGLCEKWKFPKSFAMVTGFHHRPMDVPAENRTLTALIYVADRLAADTGLGFRQDLMNTNIEPETLDFLKLTSEKLSEVRTQLAAQAKDVSGILG